MNNIKDIQVWLRAKNIRHYKNAKKKHIFLLTEDELIALIMESPKHIQPIIENINLHIAQEIVRMYEDEDWTPEYICKFAKDTWPQLGIHTSNAIVGAMLIRRARSLTIK
jgi:hypothetical protein